MKWYYLAELWMKKYSYISCDLSENCEKFIVVIIVNQSTKLKGKILSIYILYQICQKNLFISMSITTLYNQISAKVIILVRNFYKIVN